MFFILLIPRCANLSAIEADLFAALRDVRLAIAKQQNIPAFVVFSDSTLTDMCAKRPVKIEDFLKVSGVGRVKAERYGKAFLEAIANYKG